MRRWSTRSQNSLKGIHPDLRAVMDQALQDSPHDFVVTEGLRTLARQKDLVRIGASKTMNSRHITGHAIDLYAWVDLNRDGKVVFEEMANPRILTDIAKSIKATAERMSVPIVWGGDWRNFVDMPHFELNRRKYPA